MKQLALCRHVVFLAVVLFAQDSLAEDYTRSNLPEGAVARLGNGLEGHTDRVYSVVFSPDGATLASGIGSLAKSEDGMVRFGDGAVRLWDVASGQERAVLEGQTHWVYSVSFSPDGATLASGSDDSVRLWDVASGRETAVLEGHSDRVNSVVFSPDGTTVASGSDDGTLRLWDVVSGREIAVLDHSDGGDGTHWYVLSVVFSPDGTTVATGSGDWAKYGKVRSWNVASGRETVILEGLTSWVSSVSFSPDGASLASAQSDHRVRLWASGRETVVLEGHTGGVRSVSFSPDGTTLASGSWDETVRLWDVASGRETAVLEGHTDGVSSLSFSPDGTTLASGSEDGTVLLWDMTPYIGPATPMAIHTLETGPTQTALLATYPNPFNSRTHIAYRLVAPGPVRLSVYNALGQPVRALVDGFQDAGAYQVAWDARDDRGASVSSGVYLTRLRHAHGVQAWRLLYLKAALQ